MAKLQLSAFSDEYADSFPDQLEAMNRLDIDYIELRFVDKKNVSLLTEEEVKKTAALLHSAGVRVSAIGSPLGKVAVDSNLHEHLELTKRLCETACRMDTKLMRIFSFYLPKGEVPEQFRNQVIDRLGQMLDVADSFGIQLCHENEADIYGETPQRCLELMEAMGGRLKCVFDMGNFAFCGYSPYPQAYEKLKPYLGYFHIKDALSAGAIVPPGKGEAQISEILKDYQKTGEKDTFITLEPHLQTFSGLNALVGKSFDNPYKFENQQVAFEEALRCLKEVLA
jgi:sugar phosphate isomerase/epimerase